MHILQTPEQLQAQTLPEKIVCNPECVDIVRSEKNGITMQTILNLTQHPATSDQIAAGVMDFQDGDLTALKALLTFATLPSAADVVAHAEEIAALAVYVLTVAGDRSCVGAMIGGAPYLMGPLARALARRRIRALYSFSVRESAESVQTDGSVKKTTVFRHTGFVGGLT